MVEGRAAPTRPTSRQGVLNKVAAASGQLLFWLVASLALSIVVEWIGMTLWWPEQGYAHSRRMLETELSYLRSDLRRNLVTSDPVRFATKIADRVHHVLFEVTRVDRLLEWAWASPTSEGGGMRLHIRSAVEWLARYLLAAMQVTQVFSVRLAVLTLALPLFAVFALVALVDGLVRRDLRRWGGGRESAFVYHWAKRTAPPMLILAWVVYLALPISIHPALVVLPFAVLFSVAVNTTAGSFKKYL